MENCRALISIKNNLGESEPEESPLQEETTEDEDEPELKLPKLVDYQTTRQPTASASGLHSPSAQYSGYIDEVSSLTIDQHDPVQFWRERKEKYSKL